MAFDCIATLHRRLTSEMIIKVPWDSLDAKEGLRKIPVNRPRKSSVGSLETFAWGDSEVVLLRTPKEATDVIVYLCTCLKNLIFKKRRCLSGTLEY